MRKKNQTTTIELCIIRQSIDQRPGSRCPLQSIPLLLLTPKSYSKFGQNKLAENQSKINSMCREWIWYRELNLCINVVIINVKNLVPPVTSNIFKKKHPCYLLLRWRGDTTARKLSLALKNCQQFSKISMKSSKSFFRKKLKIPKWQYNAIYIIIIFFKK